MALRVAKLTNRSLLLPPLLPVVGWDDVFDTCELRRKMCILTEGVETLAGAVSPTTSVSGLLLQGARSQISTYLGRPLTVLRLPPSMRKQPLSTSSLADYIGAAFDTSSVVLLVDGLLHVRRELSRACEAAHVRPHCVHPGVAFWVPPPPNVLAFWRLLKLRATLASRVRGVVHRITGDSGKRFVGVHMRHADGSCEDRVSIWWGGKKLARRPVCGKIPGCTSLDHSCCDYELTPDPLATDRANAHVEHAAHEFCEAALSSGVLLTQLARSQGVNDAFIAADGQQPLLEQRLASTLGASGMRVWNTTHRSAKVWSSAYVHKQHGAAGGTWTVVEVEDALVDMYVLAEAHAFVANPASSFSGSVRDIRAAHGLEPASTFVGIPPHDAGATGMMFVD